MSSYHEPASLLKTLRGWYVLLPLAGNTLNNIRGSLKLVQLQRTGDTGVWCGRFELSLGGTDTVISV